MFYDTKASGGRIKLLRNHSDMTQEQLAQELNIATSTLGNIERGKRGISIDLAIEIAVLFHTSLDYIILGNENSTDAIKITIHDMIMQLLVLEKQL